MSCKLQSIVVFAVATMLVACSNSATDNNDATSGGNANGETPTTNDQPSDDGSPADQQPIGNLGPEGTSSVVVSDHRYPLKSALGDIWGVEDSHYHVDFTLTDGKFLVQPTTVNGQVQSLLIPVSASAIVYAELFSPGGSLAFDTYSYAASDATSGLDGTAYFNNAIVGVDIDNSGEVEEQERLSIIDGTLIFSGALPDIELQFDVTLSDGKTAVGHYSGLFDFADRR